MSGSHEMGESGRSGLPSWAPDDDPREVLASVDDWAVRVASSGLVEAFGGVPLTSRGRELLDDVERFAAATWDFRSGWERNLASRAEFTSAQEGLVTRVAADLGLAGGWWPSRRRFDAVVLTGGMVRAGLVKPRFLRELAARGFEFGEVVFLGAFRSFAGDEVLLAKALGVPGSDEVDAMREGLVREFGAPQHPEPAVSEGGAGGPAWGRWRVESWVAGGQRVSVVAAPSSDAVSRRAHTADTFRFWRDRVHGVRSVLVVTTPVYVPYQNAVAVDVFGCHGGMAVESVAVSETANDLGEWTQEFGVQQVLQELRSAARGMRDLRITISTLARQPGGPSSTL